jgi:hypothetical protein
MRIIYRNLQRLVLILCVGGCSHEALFSASPREAPPRGSGSFHRITYNVENDRFPNWLPGATELAYSFAPGDVGTVDQCLGTIPAEGGVRRTVACRRAGPVDSIANSSWPAADVDGRLVYVWEPLRPFPSTPRPDSALVYLLDAVGDSSSSHVIYRFPFFIPGTGVFTSGTHLGWLNRDTIVAIAVGDFQVRDCSGCAFRTVRAGRAVILLDLTTAPATLSIVPGTDAASAVVPGLTGRDFYYTIIGDSRVFHGDIANTSPSVIHDFGAAGIARDPQVLNGRLIVVVGGNINYRVDALAGPIQEDSGGPLHSVDLGSGLGLVLPDSGVLYRHPTLTTGNRLVAEGWSGGSSDLWFFTLP